MTLAHSKFNYLYGIILLSLCYFIFQYFFIPYEILAVDEFWNSHHIYQYTLHTPYKDFLPYKTILGYYLLSIPLYFSHGILTPIFYIKNEISFINTLLICCIALWSTRFFQAKAIFATLALILMTPLFLLHSTELRIDMLATWLGMLSALCILSQRHFLAGMLIGLSFLVSQKAFWFFGATNIALGIQFLIFRNRDSFISIIKMNVGVFLPIIAYVLYWGMVSTFDTVLNSLFYEAYTQSKITWYSHIYYDCWQGILLSEPVLFLLTPLTWLGLLRKSTDYATHSRRLFIIFYSTSLLFFIASYQQAFPYNMVCCFPAFFLLYSDFFSWDLKSETIHKRLLFWMSYAAALFPISMCIIFDLPAAYYAMSLVPIFVGMVLRYPTSINNHLLITLNKLILLFIGIIYPLIQFAVIAYDMNGKYQQSMMRLTTEILSDGGDYFAGTPLLYRKDQSIAGLRNLIGPSIDYLYYPSKNLLPVLLDSLYLTPRSPDQIMSDLKSNPVKLYVYNARINQLPYRMLNFLGTQYQQYWGSIYLYAPQIPADKQHFKIAFSGNYRVIAPGLDNVIIDKHHIKTNTIIFLTVGKHLSLSNHTYRLKLLPDEKKLELNPEYRQNRWGDMLKSIPI